MVWVLNNRYTFISRKLIFKINFSEDLNIFSLCFVNQYTQNTCNENSKAMHWQLFLFSLDGIFSKILRKEFSMLIFLLQMYRRIVLRRISFSSAGVCGLSDNISHYHTTVRPSHKFTAAKISRKYATSKNRPEKAKLYSRRMMLVNHKKKRKESFNCVRWDAEMCASEISLLFWMGSHQAVMFQFLSLTET